MNRAIQQWIAWLILITKFNEYWTRPLGVIDLDIHWFHTLWFTRYSHCNSHYVHLYYISNIYKTWICLKTFSCILLLNKSKYWSTEIRALMIDRFSVAFRPVSLILYRESSFPMKCCSKINFNHLIFKHTV